MRSSLGSWCLDATIRALSSQTCGRRVRERHGVFVLITPEPEHVVLAPTAVWPWCVCVCRTHRVLSLITSVNVKVSLSAYTPPASTRVCRLMRQQICQRIEPAFGQTICHRACQRHGIFHLFTRVSERDSLITGVDIEVSVLTCAPPLMSGLCLLMLPAEHEVRLAHHGTPWCKRLRLLRTAVSRYRSCPGTLEHAFWLLTLIVLRLSSSWVCSVTLRCHACGRPARGTGTASRGHHSACEAFP